MKSNMAKFNGVKARTYRPLTNTVSPNFDIDTPSRKALFFSQLAHEIGDLKYAEKNLKYSAKAMRCVFRKYFGTNEIAEQ